MSLCKKEYNITWIIENYLYCDRRSGVPLRSPAFIFPDMKAYKFYIDFFPRGKDAVFAKYVCLRFWCSSGCSNSEEIMMDLKMALCNADKEVVVELEGGERLLGCDYWYEFPIVIEVEEMERKLKSTNDTLFARFSMSTKKKVNVKNSTNVNETNIIYKTTIDFDKFSFNWKVYFDDFSALLMRKTFTDMNDTKFEINVEAPEDDVIIEIKRIGKYLSRNHKVKGQMFFLKDSDNEILTSCDDIFFFDHKLPKKNTWHFPSFLKKSYMLNHLDTSCFLKFNFFVSNDMSVGKYIKKTENLPLCSFFMTPDIPAINSLQDDLKALFSDDKYSDVKLRVDGQVICAHKAILAYRSPVFKAMFDQDMIEKQKGEVHILDIKAVTMSLFLKFVYTGILDEPDNNTAMELLLAAEKYKVPSLVEKCCSSLEVQLNHDNICEIVSVADMLEHKILKNSAINYIKKHAAEILGSSKWQQWIEKNPKLGSKILCNFSNIIKESI